MWVILILYLSGNTLSPLVSSLVCSDDDSIDDEDDDDVIKSLSVELGSYKLLALLLSALRGTCCGVPSGVLEIKKANK